MSLTRHQLSQELHRDLSSSKCNEQRVWQWVWLVHVTNWGKQWEWWLLSPSIPKDRHTLCSFHGTAGHSSPGPGLSTFPTAAEPGGTAVPALPRAHKGRRTTFARVERAHSRGLSSRECTHLSQGCGRGSSGLQPVLYLLQTKSVCTENSPAGAVSRLQTNTIL